MLDASPGSSSINSQGGQRAWVYQLNRYQWFVLAICTLGWVFDCMDQQLFNLVPQTSRRRADGRGAGFARSG